MRAHLTRWLVLLTASLAALATSVAVVPSGGAWADGDCASVTQPDDPDTDGDGLADRCDPDIDADGVSNADEQTYGSDPLRPDTDGDLLPDGTENSDHDGLRDSGETDATKADTDGDGLSDGTEDANWNGVVDEEESDPLRVDTDSDGVKDGSDNCPVVANEEQDDWDFDGSGDACDPDTDITLSVRTAANRYPRITRLGGKRYFLLHRATRSVLRGRVVPKLERGRVHIRIAYRGCRPCRLIVLHTIDTRLSDNSTYETRYRFHYRGFYSVKASLDPVGSYSGADGITYRVRAR